MSPSMTMDTVHLVCEDDAVLELTVTSFFLATTIVRYLDSDKMFNKCTSTMLLIIPTTSLCIFNSSH